MRLELEDLNPVTYFWKLRKLSAKALDDQDERLSMVYHNRALYLRKMYPHVDAAWLKFEDELRLDEANSAQMGWDNGQADPR